MREIKFRAWDKSDGQMYYAIEDGIRFDDGSVYEFRNFLAPKEDDYHKWEVMQYTGIHDKNGKEIYEGDVLKYDDWDEKEDDDRMITDSFTEVVKWSKERGHFCTESSELVWAEVARMSEVIGNIYENTDLTRFKNRSIL